MSPSPFHDGRVRLSEPPPGAQLPEDLVLARLPEPPPGARLAAALVGARLDVAPPVFTVTFDPPLAFRWTPTRRRS